LNRSGTEVPGARVPTRIAAFWGLGAFATTTMLNGVSIVLLFFLVNFVKIEPVIAGGLLFASKLFDACIDPPIGVLSDRTVSRFGRRRPWLLGASFFCGLSFAMLFNIGALLSAMGFDKNLAPSADQSPAAGQAMLLGFVWIPVGTQLAAMLLLRWYRLEQRDLVPAATVVRTARV
jgi:Na+/melibiose symporter-like transporter